MSTALLVIDAQRSFYEGFHIAPWPAMPPMPAAEAKLATLAGLIGRARAAGVPVVFVQHCEPGSELEKGTALWQLHPALGVLPGDPVVEKTTPDAFHQTGLKALLDRLGAEALVIAGNQTDMCINASTRAAAALGYGVTLAADAHGTWDADGRSAADIIADHNRAMAQGIARVLPAADIGWD